MIENTEIARIRRDYKLAELNEFTVFDNPFKQFSKWMEEAVKSNIIDPNAMVLATADRNAHPAARVVLLKGFDSEGFVFFTNYESKKGKSLIVNPNASILFFWKEFERQIRISGRVKKVFQAESLEYFNSRPFESRIAAWASNQSKVIPDREYLEKRFNELKEKHKDGEVPLPPFWGGFKLFADSFEFWQGRENRLHDRICYEKENNKWKISRLAP
ncbi:MAG: pyridoxamine 5'-phosphate oxidase [Ignavibacteriaceae bacterium]|nr:pyridoxamine 5'-phosphate oxidase [Ignavibacteriaceae bacterium]